MPMDQDKADRLATASMVLGFASLMCTCLTGVPAVLLGALSYGDASDSGRLRAKLGIGAGVIITVLTLLGSMLGGVFDGDSDDEDEAAPAGVVQPLEEDVPATGPREALPEPTPVHIDVRFGDRPIGPPPDSELVAPSAMTPPLGSKLPQPGGAAFVPPPVPNVPNAAPSPWPAAGPAAGDPGVTLPAAAPPAPPTGADPAAGKKHANDE